MTPTKKARVWTMVEKEGKSITETAHALDLNRSTVSRAHKKLLEQGPNPDFYLEVPRSGRPSSISPRLERRAVRYITSGRASDATDLQRQLFTDLHPTTIRRMLIRHCLFGRWAEGFIGWKVSKWKRVWFADESKFNLFGSDGRMYCCRRPGEELEPRNVKPVVKHGGGSLMVWGVLTWKGPGRLHRVEGKMNALQYTSILSDSLLGTAHDQKRKPSSIVLAQDLDSKHTS
ncbi:hypothetical protein EVG20_g5806 [Dentipellis fragilis]|uniref:Tc1-like transposase DDE domain-containing protein n=1 Tax=Dentipellis fragilis TaxID=205917 RepID=A0A4Y9YQY1_9AGAM|nr:hypothetical protein EVG20_g5806 [Dentipellis fragilis]